MCSSPTRWFVGLTGDERTVLLDARLDGGDEPSPARVRRHCGHEVAFCVLTGLAERFARLDRRDPARRALALRLALPVDEEVRRIVESAHTEVSDLLRSHRDNLDSLVAGLLERETLSAEDIKIMARGEKLPPLARGGSSLTPPAPPAIPNPVHEPRRNPPLLGGPEPSPA